MKFSIRMELVVDAEDSTSASNIGIDMLEHLSDVFLGGRDDILVGLDVQPKEEPHKLSSATP